MAGPQKNLWTGVEKRKSSVPFGIQALNLSEGSRYTDDTILAARE
jgi:hypothetical protein